MRLIPVANSSSRNSGGVSIRMLPCAVVMTAAQRFRQLRGSVEVHTSQSQPRAGTPVEVPVPRKVNRRFVMQSSYYLEERTAETQRAQRKTREVDRLFSLRTLRSTLLHLRSRLR